MIATSEPSIEVTIPFYGRFDYLREAVLSVLDQDDVNWRLTVYDDNPAPLPAVAAWFEERTDSRVTYVVNERPLGVSANFNQCVARCDADHVVLMGCDDRMRPDYLAAARRALAVADASVIYQPGVRVIDEEGKPVLPLQDRLKRVLTPRARDLTTLSGESFARSLMRGTWTYFPALLWPTELVRRQGFDLESSVVQDTRLLVDLALDGAALCVDPTPTFEYRRHSSAASSLAAQTGSRFEEERAMYTEFDHRLRDRGWTSAARAARWHVSSRLHAVVVAAEAVRGRDVSTARTLLREHTLGGRARTG